MNDYVVLPHRYVINILATAVHHLLVQCYETSHRATSLVYIDTQVNQHRRDVSNGCVVRVSKGHDGPRLLVHNPRILLSSFITIDGYAKKMVYVKYID